MEETHQCGFLLTMVLLVVTSPHTYIT